MRRLNVSFVLIVATLCMACSMTTVDSPARSEMEGGLQGAEADAIEPGERVSLVVGHCFVEPIKVAGREWVTKKPYVGYGGGLPDGFTKDGVFRVESATSAVFLAEGGAKIRFRRAPDPLPVLGCR